MILFYYFRLQPHADTRAKQIAGWKSLMLEYYRNTKQSIVDVRELHTNPLFHNTNINRILLLNYTEICSYANIQTTIRKIFNNIIIGQLSSEAVLLILEELAKSGNACPLDKTKQRWLVYWHTLEEWGDIIYNWAQENGFVGSVCTLFELTQGEDTTEQGIL